MTSRESGKHSGIDDFILLAEGGKKVSAEIALGKTPVIQKAHPDETDYGEREVRLPAGGGLHPEPRR